MKSIGASTVSPSQGFPVDAEYEHVGDVLITGNARRDMCVTARRPPVQVEER